MNASRLPADGPSPADANPPPFSLPSEVLQTLAVRWLQHFETAARSESRHVALQLFDHEALLAGTHKGGPLDTILSKTFHFETNTARVLSHGMNVLFLCSWHAVSPVHGGATRKGDATFYAGVQLREDGKREFRCYHAHFSEVAL